MWGMQVLSADSSQGCCIPEMWNVSLNSEGGGVTYVARHTCAMQRPGRSNLMDVIVFSARVLEYVRSVKRFCWIRIGPYYAAIRP
jgi:hypothetical protein